MADTVSADGWEITSSHETADDMVSALTPPPEDGGEPKALVKDGRAVKPEDEEKESVSKAAAELGRKGGEAAAKKRAEAEKDEEKRASKAEDEDESAEEKKEPEKPLGKPRHDPRARMLEATREAAELKRMLAQERAERERLAADVAAMRAERSPSRPQQDPEPRPAAGDEKPKAEDFEDYEEFVDARSRWAFREEYRKHREQERREQQAQLVETGVERGIAQMNARIDKTLKSDPDFLDKVSPEVLHLRVSLDLPEGQMPGPLNIVADEIFSSEIAPALMLHFTEHPEALQRLAALPSPRDISREMAKIEMRLQAATAGTAPKPEVSKAKPPIRPVIGSPYTADAPGDDASFDEHFRYWNAKERRR